jgi:outer membrane protein OmpA-like peptidoglycan-associated protein
LRTALALASGLMSLAVAGGALWAQGPTGGASPPAATTATPRKSEAQLLGRIVFAAATPQLPADAAAQIDAIVRQIPPPGSDGRRIQLLGFASGDQQLVSANRRLSLERALAVREQLRARGVALDRIDVRALGTTRLGEATLDRVDVMLGTAEVPTSKPVRK